MTARDEALKRLAKKFPLDYIKLYRLEKGNGTGPRVNSVARSRALVKLTHLFSYEYKELYKIAASEGYRRSHRY